MNDLMPSPHPSWETALERYSDFRKTHDLSEAYRAEQQRLLCEIREAFPHTRSPFDLQENELLDFFLKLKTQRVLAGHSRSQYAIALRGFLKYTGAPAKRWIPRFPKSMPTDKGRYLDASTRAKLWSACSNPEDEAILVMGLAMGWRRSDLVRANLSDFEPSIEAPQRVTLHGKGEKFQTLTLELHPKCREIIPKFAIWRAAQIAHATVIMGVKPTDPDALLVAASKRDGINRMCDSTFEKRINRIYERAGVDRGEWPSHDLRRTWAENRLKAAMEEFSFTHNPVEALELALRVVAREGRWKSVETLRRYLMRKVVLSSASLAKTLV